MKQELIDILEAFGYPVFLHGTVNDDESYPNSFFTFWNFDTPEAAYYDDEANRAIWGFWVYFYSTNPALVESVPERARKVLKGAGWVLQGKAHDIASVRPTHTGALFTAYKFEEYNESEV